LSYLKKGPDRLSAPKTLSFSDKIAKIGLVVPGIVVLRGIILKKKKINASKIYSLVGNRAKYSK